MYIRSYFSEFVAVCKDPFLYAKYTMFMYTTMVITPCLLQDIYLHFLYVYDVVYVHMFMQHFNKSGEGLLIWTDG